MLSLRGPDWRDVTEVCGHCVVEWLDPRQSPAGELIFPCSVQVLDKAGVRKVVKVIPLSKSRGARDVKMVGAVSHKFIAPADLHLDADEHIAYAVSPWDPSLQRVPDLTGRVAAQCLCQLCSALHYLCRTVPESPTTGFNIKTGNLSSTPAGIRVHDWYVPYLMGGTTRGLADAQGLAKWLHIALYGVLPQVSVIESDQRMQPAYKTLMLRLLEESETMWFTTVRSHPWLSVMHCHEQANELDEFPLSISPTNMRSGSVHRSISESSVRSGRRVVVVPPVLDVAQKVTGRLAASLREPSVCESSQVDTLQLVQLLLLKAALNGSCTDRYLSYNVFEQLLRRAEELCARCNYVVTDEELDTMEWQPTSTLFHPNPHLRQVVPREGVWFSSGSSRVNQDTVIHIRSLGRYCTGEAECPGNRDYYCAVFDGHGGLEAAEFCAYQFADAIGKSPHYATDVLAAMKEAYENVHTRFIGKSESPTSGSTATTVIVRDDTVYCANVGDSSAVIGAKDRAVVLTATHRPTNQEERRRVEERGGCILKVMGVDRVEGRLAVTRSIGDVGVHTKLSHEPHTTSYAITPDDEFIVVASDGLWDVMSPAEVCSFVWHCSDEVLSLMTGTVTTQRSKMSTTISASRTLSLFDEASICSNRGTSRKSLPQARAILLSEEPASVDLSVSRRRLADRASEGSRSQLTTTETEECSDYQVVAEALVQEARDRGSEDDCTVSVVYLLPFGDRKGQ